jgi:BASS family bile acid:Na+ symporter
MQDSIIFDLLLPIALGIIMLGLGLSLTVADFRRVLSYPKAVLFGLFLQTGILPWAAFAIAIAMRLPPELAVGLMLLAASPGGATANVYSHLARGDVALNITLTATNSLLCLVTLPIIVGLSLGWFMDADAYVPPPFKKVIEVGAIILLPVLIGMTIRHFATGFARRMEKPLKIFSIAVLALLIAAVLQAEWKVLVAYAATVGVACLLFNLVSMGSGYGLSLAIRLPRRQAIAIAMEIGIHNGTLAIFIALNVLGNNLMSVPAAIYSLIMFVTAGIFAWWLTRRRSGAAA